jgi:hypothetical protein
VIEKRYRMGRLVRARRLRRATLENARNLVLERIDGMLATMDRFSAMVVALRADGQTPAATETDGTRAARCSAAADQHGAEPDMFGRASTWESQAFDEASVGGQALPTGSDTTTHS